MALTFKGGLHLPDYKSSTQDRPSQNIKPADIYYFPINQHKGAPLHAIVKEGDYVKIGQKIADTEEYMASPLHSSISGTVKKIEPHINNFGVKTDTIVIENNYLDEVFEGVRPIENIDSLSKRELLWVVRDAGLIGFGGAGFPTHVKLNPKTQIKHLIINGAECEPYITSDHRRMLENTEELLEGIRIVMKILDVKTASIGVETNKRDAIIKLREALRYKTDISVIPLKPKYPQGGEKQLIKAITGLDVPTGKLPADVGAMVINVDTVYNIYRAFVKGLPVIERIITVSGDAVKKPCNLRVRLGVPISYLFEQAGGFVEKPHKIIIGGPMMGFAQYSLDVPASKTTSSLIALLQPDSAYDENMPCLNCGKCVRNCPMRLMPNHLNNAAIKRNVEEAVKLNILDCIECGLCSYTCPSKRSMLQNISGFKPEVITYIRSRKEQS